MSFVLICVLSALNFIALVLMNSFIYLRHRFPDVAFSIVVYQLSSPLKGTSGEELYGYLWNGIAKSLIEFAILLLVVWLLGKILKKNKAKTAVRLVWLVGILIAASVVTYSKAREAGAIAYVKSYSDVSEIYEKHYVDPEKADIKFPDNKRNLLFIYMESMEGTYSDEESGGGKPYNCIPNLTALANKEGNISFSETGRFGGYQTPDAWTMGALIDSTAGINYQLPIYLEYDVEYENMLPGAVTLGDILKKNGYQNYFMCGSDAVFAGRELYFREHGDYEILDYKWAVENKKIPEDYYVFWGYEDEKLYSFAKEELTKIAAKDEPFNFTMLTVDTHHMYGYLCELCQDDYVDQYARVISCADRQINDFLNWASEQEWYENTAIVVVGDHTTMNSEFFGDVKKEYRRCVYNCFINSKQDPYYVDNLYRQMNSFDLFPTTLAALGVEIPGDRLALGTNMFSKTKSLEEEMGTEAYRSELAKKSRYYMSNFIRN